MAESAAIKTKSTSYVDRLESELNRMVNEQFTSPEFRFIAETPLTMARAKLYTLQMVFYAANRRDCWAYVQARAPLDVKQAIWHHEQDELIVDPRGGTDHMTLMSREAVALGVTSQELAASQPTPLLKAALLAFCYNASTLPWLAGLAHSTFLTSPIRQSQYWPRQLLTGYWHSIGIRPAIASHICPRASCPLLRVKKASACCFH